MSLYVTHMDKGYVQTFENIDVTKGPHRLEIDPEDTIDKLQRMSWGFDQSQQLHNRLNGQKAPALHVSQWVQGEYDSNDLTGKRIMLVFWDKDSPEVEERIRLMNAYHHATSRSELTVIGVHAVTDDVDVIKNIIDSHDILCPIAVDLPIEGRDSDGVLHEFYGNGNRTPAVIIDSNGTIHGGRISELDKTLRELVKGG